MTADWDQIAAQVRAPWSYPQEVARDVLEQLVGATVIREAVDIALDFESPTFDLRRYDMVRHLLLFLGSLEACERAREIYRQAADIRVAAQALDLLAQMCHPRTGTWLPEFLAYPTTGQLFLLLNWLDNLLTGYAAPPEEVVTLVLEHAAQHPAAAVRARVAASRVLQEESDHTRNEQDARYVVLLNAANSLRYANMAGEQEEWAHAQETWKRSHQP